MVAELDVAGASDRVTDAPSLEASRFPKRQLQPSRRVVENSQVHTPIVPTKRKRQNPRITIYNDPPSPPPTQATDSSFTGAHQKGVNSVSRPKNRTRASKTSPAALPEEWEINFDAAKDKQSKFKVLLEALGHEDFPQKMRIPKRPGKANLKEDLDPLDPLWLWSKMVTPEVLQTIANNTNEHEAKEYKARKNHTQNERHWNDLTGPDIGAFLGTAMLMGVHSMPCLEDYWNTSEDKPIFPIQRYISRQRFEQICRYLKVNSPHEEVAEDQFFAKVEPLMSTFRQASHNLLNLPDTVSIDENLVASRTRTIHLMQIDNKAAGKGFKIYTLCSGSYLYDWIYTSKAAKVPQAKYYTPQTKGYGAFTDSERMVLTMVEVMIDSHPPEFRFTVVFDNFFSTTRLFEELRSWGVGAYGTAKKGSGMPIPHIMIDQVATKEKNYGEAVNTVVSEGRVDCITFIDQGAVWMMSTVHDTVNQSPCWRPIFKRKRASDHLSRLHGTTHEVEIPFPQISDDYNHYMNGSDLCQQSWNEYSVADHAHRRNWWPLFWHLINASITNCLYLYRIQGITDREVTHLQLQERLGLQLLRNPASVMRKVNMTTQASTNRTTLLQRPLSEHSWTRIPQRWCVVCSPASHRRRGMGKKRRQKTRDTLVEMGLNTIVPQPKAGKAGKTGKRSTWACSICEVALCKDSWCWGRHHGEIEREEAHTESSEEEDIDEYNFSNTPE